MRKIIGIVIASMVFCSSSFSFEWEKTNREIGSYLSAGYEIKFVNAFFSRVKDDTIIYTLMKDKQVISCRQYRHKFGDCYSPQK